MKKVFSLKNDFKEIIFIEEEIKIFNEIDDEIINTFKNILLRINNRKIKFSTIKKNISFDSPFILSLLDNNFKNFYPLDYRNMWSSFTFFKDYFVHSNYNFNKHTFIKIHIQNKRYKKMGKINSLISFTPFYIERLIKEKTPLDFIRNYVPKIILKDSRYYKNLSFAGFYGKYYEKSEYIQDKYKFVLSHLDDDISKIEYSNLLHANIEDNWKHYFNKVHDLCQYNDYLKIDKRSVIINCGVENGMELKLFNGSAKIFNIDPGGSKHLDKTVVSLIKKSSTKNIFIESALYNSDSVENLDQKNNIHITTLKEVIEEQKLKRIDLIKSDVEGAERYMCEDLINICLKYNSQLAISIYHTSNKDEENEKLYDLVDIPFRLIDKLRNKYNFYVKRYCHERWEAILYVIPKK